jgi:hypothetical protein
MLSQLSPAPTGASSTLSMTRIAKSDNRIERLEITIESLNARYLRAMRVWAICH